MNANSMLLVPKKK